MIIALFGKVYRAISCKIIKINIVGIGLIQQNRQDQHLQRKICIVGADAFIGQKP